VFQHNIDQIFNFSYQLYQKPPYNILFYLIHRMLDLYTILYSRSPYPIFFVHLSELPSSLTNDYSSNFHLTLYNRVAWPHCMVLKTLRSLLKIDRNRRLFCCWSDNLLRIVLNRGLQYQLAPICFGVRRQNFDLVSLST